MEKMVLELLEEKKFTKLRELFSEMEPADTAACLQEADKDKLPLLYRLLPKDVASEVFVEMDTDEQETLIKSFSDSELRAVMDELFFDDAVDIIEEMPATVVRRILANTAPEDRKTINELLNYPKDSAGSIMTTEYVSLKTDMSVKDAIERIRRIGVDKETVYTCYVTDSGRKLLGIATVRDMIFAGDDAMIGDIMDENVIFAHTADDKEDVADMMSKYDFLALPIVDAEERLVGIVTVDDAMDVLEEEATEDIEKMAAITPTGETTPYLKTKILSLFRARAPWQLLLMISATFTGLIIAGFEEKLASVTVLTAFIPMLMNTGGNTGSQAAVTVIRALSLKEIEFRDTLRVMWKEIRLALLCSVTLAVVNFFKVLLVDGMLLSNPAVTVGVAAVISITLIVTVIASQIVGSALPMITYKIGLDPAVMSSPFITTIVDALSLLIYFRVASLLLQI